MAKSGERAASAPRLIATNVVFIEVLPKRAVELYRFERSQSGRTG
jgi:hypothetical protein